MCDLRLKSGLKISALYSKSRSPLALSSRTNLDYFGAFICNVNLHASFFQHFYSGKKHVINILQRTLNQYFFQSIHPNTDPNYANVGVTGHQISQLPQIRMQMQRSQVNVKVADDRQTHRQSKNNMPP